MTQVDLWCAMFQATSDAIAKRIDRQMSPRQYSELFLRQLCANCACFVGKPDFWRYFHEAPNIPGDDTITGELMLFTILANTPADTVVEWMDEEFADDDLYIRRLSPFYVAPPEGYAA